MKKGSCTVLFLFLFCVTSCRPPEPALVGTTSNAWSNKWITPTINGPETPPPPVADHPLNTTELIDIALWNNPLTKRSWNLARQAAFEVGMQESSLYPAITGIETLTFNQADIPSIGNGNIINGGTNNGSVVNNNTNVPILPDYTISVQHQLVLNYLLLDFGGRCADIRAAQYALLSLNWTHNRVLQNVMLNVFQAYYSYSSYKALLEAREQDLKDSQTSLEASLALFEAGIGTRLDTLLAQSNFVNIQLQLETTRGQMHTALGQLSTAVGLPAEIKLEVEAVPEKLPLDEISAGMDALIETAKTMRPDLASVYSDFLQSQELIISAYSDGMPTLCADGYIQDTNFIHQPAFNNTIYTGSLVLSVPIFAGFYYTNELASAKAAAAASFATWQEKRNTVLLDVVTSYYAYATALKTVKYSEEYLKYSQEAYDSALATYKEGVGSILDLLAAQSALANARAQIILAKTQLLVSAVSLAYSTGTL